MTTLEDMINEAIDVYEKRKSGDEDATYGKVDYKFRKQEPYSNNRAGYKPTEDDFIIVPNEISELEFNQIADLFIQSGYDYNVLSEDIRNALNIAGVNITTTPTMYEYDVTGDLAQYIRRAVYAGPDYSPSLMGFAI